jgi:hypothetical protein
MATLRCKILAISDKVNVSKTDKPFEKIEVVAQSFVEVNGNDYEEVWPFQASNEKCSLFDDVNVGDTVDLRYNRRGFIMAKKADIAKTAKNPNHISCMSNFEVVSLSIVERKNETIKHVSPKIDGKEGEDDLPF